MILFSSTLSHTQHGKIEPPMNDDTAALVLYMLIYYYTTHMGGGRCSEGENSLSSESHRNHRHRNDTYEIEFF